jgi:hypothetical protein
MSEEKVKAYWDPLLGHCEHKLFYVVNEAYGGYFSQCSKGSESADYVDAKEIVKLAEKVGMKVSLAGGVWIEVGKSGFGEEVSADEAERLVDELRLKRRVF